MKSTHFLANRDDLNVCQLVHETPDADILQSEIKFTQNGVVGEEGIGKAHC